VKSSKIEKFEDLIIWQKSKDLSFMAYEKFRSHKDYSFRDQILRAAVSVMNNIAEGFERSGNKEYSRFLFISKGSCGEFRSMLYLGKELGYLNDKEFASFYQQSMEISKMLYSLIKRL